MPVDHKQDRVILQHPKGPSVEILLYGASIISWKSALKGKSQEAEEVEERLFVSSKASLDGSKPVRGGIPVVFPCFGPPTHPQHSKLSQHGFARNTMWTFTSTVMDNEAGVSIRLTLDPTPAIKAIYDYSFHLVYVVTLAEHQLSTDLHVENTSSEAIEFQALFHNYIKAPSDQVLIYPLAGKSYYDKTESTEEARSLSKTEQRDGVDVKKFTDFVYEDAGNNYQVRWPAGGIDIRTVALKDLVVWNPQAEVGKNIGDMEDAGWEKYVCVEPGYVRGFVRLHAGKSWLGLQVITAVEGDLTSKF